MKLVKIDASGKRLATGSKQAHLAKEVVSLNHATGLLHTSRGSQVEGNSIPNPSGLVDARHDPDGMVLESTNRYH